MVVCSGVYWKLIMVNTYSVMGFAEDFLGRFDLDPSIVISYFTAGFMERFVTEFKLDYEKKMYIPANTAKEVLALQAYNILLFHYPTMQDHVGKLARPFFKITPEEQDLITLFLNVKRARTSPLKKARTRTLEERAA